MENNTQLQSKLNEIVEHEMNIRQIHSLVVMCEIQNIQNYIDIPADEYEIQVLRSYDPNIRLDKQYFIGSEKLTDKFPIFLPIVHSFDSINLEGPRKLFLIDMVGNKTFINEFYTFTYQAMLKGHVVLVKTKTRNCPFAKGPNALLYKKHGIAIYNMGVAQDD